MSELVEEESQWREEEEEYSMIELGMWKQGWCVCACVCVFV